MIVFIAGSAAVHALVLDLLTGFPQHNDPEHVSLEVTLTKAKPLPVALPTPEPPPVKTKPQSRHKPEPATTPKTTQARPHAGQQVPVLSLPASPSPAEDTFAIPAARPAEPPPAPAQKPQVASAAVIPPTFNAAYLRNPAPRYPLAARRFGEQGTVMVRVLVTPEGLPARVDLEKTSGSVHLDNAAIEAVKGWRFTPARRGNEAVEGWVLVPIVFRLEG